MQVDAEDGGVTAYAPFGAGRTSCVGKYLAYQEMGIILARLSWLFDMRLDSVHREEGDKKKGDAAWGRNRRDEFQTRDVFTSSHDGPVVQFRRRISFTPPYSDDDIHNSLFVTYYSSSYSSKFQTFSNLSINYSSK